MTQNRKDPALASLMEKFRSSEEQTEEEILKNNWRSIVCQSCGICCCSDVIPIGRADFEAFHRRLGVGVDLDTFAGMFLSDPVTEAVNHTIETARYGGRCMFLGKGAHFECVVWGVKPDVCSGYYCWEMTNFEKWLNGDEQDSFEGSEEDFMANFERLRRKVKEESPLSFFPENMANYLRLAQSEDSPAFYAAGESFFHDG